MKIFLCIWVLILPLLMRAQGEDGKGIRWATGLSWEQVKKKAKAENKFIFIDAYTTWCGPCKMMDKYVYPNDTVGNFFNKHFIAVKAQMDVTDKDDKNITGWYADATTIKTEYRVEAYPSLIFLSPEGKIVHKEQGYRSVDKFIDVAKSALTPGKVFKDPYEEYNRLVREYDNGIKHYEKMPYMIKTAVKIGDNDFANHLAKEHTNYCLADSNRSTRYSKDNLLLWATYSLSSQSRLFRLFKRDAEEIDKNLGSSGFAVSVTDQTIQREVVDSFFRMQKGETMTVTGKRALNSEIMFMSVPIRSDGKIEPDYVEADWKKLGKMIRKNFGKEDVERNVSKARIRWYQHHQNFLGAAKVKLMQIEKAPPADIALADYAINNGIGWPIFLYATDKKLLGNAAEWMLKLIESKLPNDVFLDTYANLLYKMGRANEAIEWEEKALSVVNPKNEELKDTYLNIISQMKNGEPTYVNEGAIWLNR